MGSARLACLIHVASIHPGPGSNPQKEGLSTCVGKLSNSSRQLQKILFLFPFGRKKGLCWLYVAFLPHSYAFHFLNPCGFVFTKFVVLYLGILEKKSLAHLKMVMIFSLCCNPNLFAAIAGLSSFFLFFGCFFCHLIFNNSLHREYSLFQNRCQ